MLSHFTAGKLNNIMVLLHTHQGPAQNARYLGEREEIPKPAGPTRPKADQGPSREGLRWGGAGVPIGRAP